MTLTPGPLVVALALAVPYAVGARLHAAADAARGGWTRPWLSAAAGAAVAYVFVDILPELAARREAFVAASGADLLFAEQRIYIVALAGFLAFYGLEHIVLAARACGRRHAGGGAGDAVYWLHAGGFAAYSGLVGYLLVHRAEAGTPALLFYGIAMALHFSVVDRTLREEHGAAYERAHWILAASVLAGWVAGATMQMSAPWLARVFAFLAGAVVITSVKAEMPREPDGQFWPFCLGAAAYTALLLAA